MKHRAPALAWAMRRLRTMIQSTATTGLARGGSAAGAAGLIIGLLMLRSAVAASPVDDCNSNDREKMLLGCSVVAAVSESPATVATALLRRGSVYKDLNKTDVAIADFTTALRMNPKLAPAFELRAQCFAQIGDHEAAYDDYNAALQLDPNNAKAQTGLAAEAKVLGPSASFKHAAAAAAPAPPATVAAPAAALRPAAAAPPPAAPNPTSPEPAAMGPPPANAGTHDWVSVALDRAGRLAWQFDANQDIAGRRALERCNDPKCRTIFTVRAHCIAYAESHSNGYWFGVASGWSHPQAVTVAMSRCGTHAPPGSCQITTNHCQGEP